MENAGYTALTRQSGLLHEMQAIANNIANLSTTGFRKEGVIFSEHVKRLGSDEPSISMAMANTRHVSLTQGPLTQTGAPFDLAIEGEGFFMVEAPDGPALTRAGSFTPSAEGELVTPDGYRVLDLGGAPIFVPPDAQIAVATDGTISADGQPLSQIGLFQPPSTDSLIHRGGTLFKLNGDAEPVEDGVILQGFIEASNVNPVNEIARMIEVQRAYELGQSFLEREDERLRGLLQAARNR